jgi:UDP-glucose 4-epimerase
MSPPRRYVVTGLAGLLGRALAARLPPAQVVAVVRREPPPGLAAQAIRADVTALEWREHLSPDTVVFHLAAAVHQRPTTDADVRRMYEVNTAATARLARACREAGATLVFASTVAVFGSVSDLVPADARPAPATDYGRSKLEAEEAVRVEGSRGLRFAILRFPLLYGPFGRGNMERMLRAIGRRRYWPVGDPATPKSALFMEDAAAALVLAEQAAGARMCTWVAAPREPPTLGRIHRAAYQAMGRWMPPGLPATVAEVAARAADAGLQLRGREPRLAEQIRTLASPAWYDGSSFAAATGFDAAVSLEDGMNRTARWLLQEGGS